jgi:hypothetical protein
MRRPWPTGGLLCHGTKKTNEKVITINPSFNLIIFQSIK